MSQDPAAAARERYRLRLFLSELRREAELRGPEEALAEIDALQAQLEADAETPPAWRTRVHALARTFGRELEPRGTPARWLAFLRWTGPGVLVLVVLTVLFERRRRRRREVSDAVIARLDEGAGADPTRE